jgi:SAM-dependent MidA family methyltransferase
MKLYEDLKIGYILILLCYRKFLGMFATAAKLKLKVDTELKILVSNRPITHKSIIKRNNKESAIGSPNNGPLVSAKGKGISKLKKDTNKANKQFIHDYSVFPESLQYRLPNENEKGQPPKPHSNIIKLIFEQGGIESMDLNLNYDKFSRYPTTNPSKLNKRIDRPNSVKMLTSDFIDDSLYNVNYGYFSKEAVIFQPDRPFDYNHLAGQDEFMQKWLQAYDKYDQEKINALQVIKRPTSGTESSKPEDKNKNKTTDKSQDVEDYQIVKPSLQLWHTPTELFQPFYGEALARHILVNYKLNNFPYDDLVIYEAGAGNGTLTLNILDFLEKNEPEVYARTKYKIIEISSKLFKKQNSRLDRHKDKVEIINKSILEWNTLVNEPCFFIALEVFDNLSHDVVRYDIDTKQPYQGYVVIDEHNDFHEYYSPELEPLTKEFLKLREQSALPIRKLKNHPAFQFYPWMKIRNILNPLRNNLSEPEYIPTRLYKLFTILEKYFPQHQILASDFSHFDKTIRGYNSPTVQTMYKDNMVNTDSYMVEQGYFDIMFPTDFKSINEMYKQVTGKNSSTCSHADFLRQWAEIEKTKTKSGENPMLELYSNADFIYSSNNPIS